jgi:two-component system, sensor histidine kinase and response regulator
MNNKNLKILVIVDNSGDIGLIKASLETITEFSYHFEEAGYLEKGLQVLSGNDFDVVLLDLSLPDADGIEGVVEIESKFQGITTIVLTGLDDEKMALDAIKNGAEDYLIKSKISGEILVRSIRYSLERNRLKKELKLSNQNLIEFSNFLSHDLNAPLRRIRWFCEKLSDEKESLKEDQKEYLERIIISTGRLKELVEGLREYSNTANGMNPEKIDSKKLLDGVLQDLEVQIHESEAQIHSGEMVEIFADPIQIRQLFLNLIGNALKFARSDQKLILSIDSWLNEKKQVMVKIADNGVGFDQDQAERIFRPLVQLKPEGRNSRENGSGLGLFICKKIVARYGGNIFAEGKEGQGATFTIYLPQNFSKKIS